MKHEVIDNRNFESFDTCKWWGIVWYNADQEIAIGFDTKKQAQWFVNGGYKEFVSDYNN